MCTLHGPYPKSTSSHLPNVTLKLRSLLQSCAGREVIIPAGDFLTAPINITSHTVLHVAAGAVLYASPLVEDYPLLPAPPSYMRSRDGDTVPKYTVFRHHPLIFAVNVQNVSIQGSGIINGSGDVWYPLRKTSKLTAGRPRMVEVMFASQIRIKDVTLCNSPFWTVHLLYCNDVHVARLKVRNPRHIANTDGVDPDSSSNVLIEDSDIICGDDAISIKSGWDAPGMDFGRPSENITIRNSIFDATTGIALGSEISGGVRNISIDNISMVTREYGVFIKTAGSRGGYIRDVNMSNLHIRMADKTGIAIIRNYTSPNPANPRSYKPPPTQISGLSFVDIHGNASKWAGTFQGVKAAPLTLKLKSVHILGSESGYVCDGVVIGTSSDVEPPATCISSNLSPTSSEGFFT